MSLNVVYKCYLSWFTTIKLPTIVQWAGVEQNCRASNSFLERFTADLIWNSDIAHSTYFLNLEADLILPKYISCWTSSIHMSLGLPWRLSQYILASSSIRGVSVLQMTENTVMWQCVSTLWSEIFKSNLVKLVWDLGLSFVDILRLLYSSFWSYF